MEKDEILENEEAKKRRKNPSKTPHIVIIVPELCKGCDICVSVCPTGVLLLQDDEKSIHGVIARVDAPEYCTGCMLCELRCPDFAIYVDLDKRGEGELRFYKEAKIGKEGYTAR
jgi:NAD-dependent dihydropyrimidine dehydrogenase PreA subunit